MQSCKKDEDNDKTDELTFTDTRDGKIYQYVIIGDQTWMAENLNYDAGIDCWCYEDNLSNATEYGRLYSWERAMHACPDGWHLPNDEEWKTMEIYLGMSQEEADNTGNRGDDIGNAMKSKSGWLNNWNGNNSSGFNAFPGGYRTNIGSYLDMGSRAWFWTATEEVNGIAWFRRLSYQADGVTRTSNDVIFGLSVRCVMDKE